MLINPNFKIEDLGENQLFFINKNKGTGYYVDNINLSRLRTLEEQGIFLQPLKEIGYYIEENMNVSIAKLSWTNGLYPNCNLSSNTVFYLLISMFMIFFSVLAIAVIKFPLPDINNLKIEGIGYIYILVLFYTGIYLIHENFHIIVAKLQGIEVKKIGFKFKYYIFPIAFVKILPTGKDRVRSNIALAGNVADLLLLIIYYFICLISKNVYFYYVLFFQFGLAFWNYNILLPTDFHLFLISYFKKRNFRSKALNYTKDFFFHPSFEKLTKITKTNVIYLLYGGATTVFFIYIYFSIFWMAYTYIIKGG